MYPRPRRRAARKIPLPSPLAVTSFFSTAAVLVALASSLTLETAAHAQAGGFAVDRFDPAERGSSWFANESLDLRGDLRPAAGFVASYASRSLVVTGDDGARTAIVARQLAGHLGGAVVFSSRVRRRNLHPGRGVRIRRVDARSGAACARAAVVRHRRCSRGRRRSRPRGARRAADPRGRHAGVFADGPARVVHRGRYGCALIHARWWQAIWAFLRTPGARAFCGGRSRCSSQATASAASSPLAPRQG